jgi:hypothetical protein
MHPQERKCFHREVPPDTASSFDRDIVKRASLSAFCMAMPQYAGNTIHLIT